MGLGSEHGSRLGLAHQQKQKAMTNPVNRKIKSQVDRHQRRRMEEEKAARAAATAAAAESDSEEDVDVKSKASAIRTKIAPPVKKHMSKSDQLMFMQRSQAKKGKNKKKKPQPTL